MSQTEEQKKAMKWFLIHGFFLVTWTPLIWVISGDIIDFYVENYKYRDQVQWGFASSHALYNIYSMAYKALSWERS